ncbi:vacuolar protein sorting-associated protein 33A [Sitodiplosis mosellana]|uniref:vacuolar protein sorting-associated protein 33A n=1 Tax=Sitodiplosis mosellana TaxID=263140 RepID=UPI002443ECEF|nr:vacuolar protein sorting-associated protein 33A [Sitodiplosis mosellana]XP_055319730.1 vacuolar protein sorting-associated protein 33A [Sitodiplosis mosellana]
MFPHLYGFRVNISLFQEAASKELLEILEKCEGTKAIVWDDSLSGPVGLVTKYAFLKERNVTKMLPLRPGALPDVDVRNIIFITRPNLKLMNCIAENVHSIDKRRGGSNKELFLYFLPRVSTLCETQLKNKGVYGSFIHVGEFKCDFFPVDNDLLSMELKDSFRDLHIEDDPTSIFLSAKALTSLQKLYGRIPKVYGKGNDAKKLWDLLKTMGKEELSSSTMGKGAIDQLIILDRSVDVMSVLTTQLTYEGLIDEVYGISQSTAHFPSDRFLSSDESNLQTSTSDKKTIILNSGEELYTELRDKNFNAIGQILSRRANEISKQLDERHNDKSVQDIKRFVERLPNMMAYKKSLATHTTIAEMLKEVTSSDQFLDELECEQEFLICLDVDKVNPFIEDMIANQAPFRTVIRLICMQSIAGSGLKQKVLDYYKRELVQVYGIEKLLAISNLEKAGLIKVQAGSRTYAVVRKTLKLTVEDTNEVTPNDISYVHTFYAPLTIRIIERALKPNGWQSLNDVLSCLPGPTFEDYQSNVGQSTLSTTRRGSFSSEISQSDTPKVILVFFLGGCTYAEISALRFLSRQEDNNVEFIVATTKLINKNTFLDNLIE